MVRARAKERRDCSFGSGERGSNWSSSGCLVSLLRGEVASGRHCWRCCQVSLESDAQVPLPVALSVSPFLSVVLLADLLTGGISTLKNHGDVGKVNLVKIALVAPAKASVWIKSGEQTRFLSSKSPFPAPLPPLQPPTLAVSDSWYLFTICKPLKVLTGTL